MTTLKHDTDLLMEMFTLRRPHGHDMEREFATRFLEPNGVYECKDTGNYIKVVGDSPTTLFSSHIDTVHKADGIQKVVYDPEKDEVFKDDKFPLGADDATGVWIMLNMIAAGVPGAYVFHIGEECGGIGSNKLAQNNEAWLRKFDHAVAFDRRGFSDVITFQSYGRCCSEIFAESLASELNLHESLVYMPCDEGIFTDTANYMDLIPECTNLSVGYDHEHTANETQHMGHARWLAEAAINVKWHELPVERDPNNYEYSPYSNCGYSNIYSSNYMPFHYNGLCLEECRKLVYEDPEIAARLLHLLDVADADVNEVRDAYSVKNKKAAVSNGNK